MVRSDGTYKFYKIQHQWKEGGEWVFSAYGQPETNSKPKKGSGISDTFTASGYCWQETGEHGVFDLRNAKTGLKNARKLVARDFKNKVLDRPLNLRLVMVTITQKTDAIN